MRLQSVLHWTQLSARLLETCWFAWPAKKHASHADACHAARRRGLLAAGIGTYLNACAAVWDVVRLGRLWQGALYHLRGLCSVICKHLLRSQPHEVHVLLDLRCSLCLVQRVLQVACRQPIL